MEPGRNVHVERLSFLAGTARRGSAAFRLSARDDGRAAPGTLVAGRIVGLGAEPERSVEPVRVPSRRVRMTSAPVLERSAQIIDRALAQEHGDPDRRTA